MRIARHISELIGNTPLVQLNSVVPEGAGTVAAKIEYLNPGGSAKDRIAIKMIDAAEASGELKPGGTIVEPTSGNTGVGLALVAQQRGYKCIFVCPDKVSEDKQNVLRAYGADVVVCPTAVAPDNPDSYYSVSNRLVEEIDGAWKPDQYSNPMGPASHYETTGPEIWADTDGKVTHFVAGVGTGGTITGAGRYLKEVSGGKVRIVGADPEGSVYSGGTGRPYLVEGVGEDFWPSAYDPTVPDEIIAVSDADSFEMTRGWRAKKPCWSVDRVAWLLSPRSRSPRRPAPIQWLSSCCLTAEEVICQRFSTMDGCLPTDFCGAGLTVRSRRRPLARYCEASPARCPTWYTPTRRRRCATRSASCGSTASRRCRSWVPSRR